MNLSQYAVPPSFLKVMTVVADIARANLCLDPPNYPDILQLDERVRIIGALRDEDEPLIRPPPSMRTVLNISYDLILMNHLISSYVSPPDLLCSSTHKAPR
jgi:hypothetical protein